MGNRPNPRAMRRSSEGGSFEQDPDQRVTIGRTRVPKGILERSPKVRPKRKDESEIEWVWNTAKEDVGRAVRGVKKILGGK